MPIDKARAGTLVQSPPNLCALASLLSCSKLRDVRQRAQAGSRLVEPDVTVRANPEDLQIDTAGLRDRRFVATALFEQIGRRPIQESDVRRID